MNPKIYAAGFFDGEGCVTTSHHNFRVTIGNTNKPVLLWFKKHFRGSVNNGHLPKNPKWTPSWKWVAASKKDVLSFLIAIELHLKIKKREARAVIKYLRRYPGNFAGRKLAKTNTAMWRSFEKTKERLRTLKTGRHYVRT